MMNSPKEVKTSLINNSLTEVEIFYLADIEITLDKDNDL